LQRLTNERRKNIMNYSKDTISKIGNAIVYLSERVSPNLSKTKLLKLLYLIEEQSVITNKIPFFGIDFQVWRLGPVAKEIYADFSEEPTLLKNYINREVGSDGNIYIHAKSKFNDDEFSDADIEIMDNVIAKYGNKNGRQLVNITHKKGTAWHYFAEKNNLLPMFENDLQNTSDVEIDFNYYLAKCESEFYHETLQMHRHFEVLKNNV